MRTSVEIDEDNQMKWRDPIHSHHYPQFEPPFYIYKNLDDMAKKRMPFAIIHDYDDAYKTWQFVKMEGYVLCNDKCILGVWM